MEARTAQNERKYYNDTIAHYTSRMKEFGWLGSQILVATLEPLLAGGELIADVGCGTGFVGAEFKKIGWSGVLIGADISEKRLKEAAELTVDGVPVYTACVQTNAYRLAFDHESFDFVVSCGMAGIAGPRSITQMRHLIKRGGYLACIATELKTIPGYPQRFQQVRNRLDRLSGVQLLFRKNLGGGYASGYNEERHIYYLFQRK